MRALRHLPFAALVALVASTTILACSDDEEGTGGSSSGSNNSSGGGGDGGGGSSGNNGEPGEPSPGCGASGGANGFQARQKLDVKGKSRVYDLFVPDGHDGKKTFPLLFALHGSGGDGAGLRGGIGFEKEANGGAIIVYPDGLNKQWDLDNKAEKNEDIKFFDALVADLSGRYCVDKSRVFVAGFSMGAYFANQLGCRRGNSIRAIAGSAGGGPYGGDDEYDENGDLVCPEAPVAAIIVHGTADDQVDLSEGKKARDYWQSANECGSATTPYDPSPCVAFSGCNPARPTVYCEIPGLGHGLWPQNAKAVWSFFKAL